MLEHFQPGVESDSPAGGLIPEEPPTRRIHSKLKMDMRTWFAVIGLVVLFVAIYALFLRFLGPSGSVLFGYPSGNITGTTTITTSFGYVCQATSKEMTCAPEFYGSLHVPVTISELSVVAFVILCLAVYYYLRRMQPSDAPSTPLSKYSVV